MDRTDYAGPHEPWHPRKNPGGFSVHNPGESLLAWTRTPSSSFPITWPPEFAPQFGGQFPPGLSTWQNLDVFHMLPTDLDENGISRWITSGNGVQRRMPEDVAQHLFETQLESGLPATRGSGNAHMDQFDMSRLIFQPLLPNELYRTGLLPPAPGAMGAVRDPDDWQSRLVFADWLDENEVMIPSTNWYGRPEVDRETGGFHYPDPDWHWMVKSAGDHERDVAEKVRQRQGYRVSLPAFDGPPPDGLDPGAQKQSRQKRFGYSADQQSAYDSYWAEGWHDPAPPTADSWWSQHNEAGRTMNYGTAEDERAFLHKIRTNPLDVTDHLVFSDWLRDQDRERDADFQAQLGGWVQDRRNWNPPIADLTEGFLDDGRVVDHDIYDLPVFDVREPNAWTDKHRYLLRHLYPQTWSAFADMTDGVEVPPDEWNWHWGADVSNPTSTTNRDVLLKHLRLPSDSLSDHVNSFGQARHWNRPLEEAERLMSGIDDLNNVDWGDFASGSLWDRVRGLLRNRFDRGQRLRSDDQPTEYAHPFKNPQGNWRRPDQDDGDQYLHDDGRVVELHGPSTAGEYFAYPIVDEAEGAPIGQFASDTRARRWLEAQGFRPFSWDDPAAPTDYADSSFTPTKPTKSPSWNYPSQVQPDEDYDDLSWMDVNIPRDDPIPAPDVYPLAPEAAAQPAQPGQRRTGGLRATLGAQPGADAQVFDYPAEPFDWSEPDPHQQELPPNSPQFWTHLLQHGLRPNTPAWNSAMQTAAVRQGRPTQASRYFRAPVDYADREALEAGILAEPWDAARHGILADWHDEFGDPREAAFRRQTMGWLPERLGVHQEPATDSAGEYAFGPRGAYVPRRFADAFKIQGFGPRTDLYQGHWLLPWSRPEPGAPLTWRMFDEQSFAFPEQMAEHLATPADQVRDGSFRTALPHLSSVDHNRRQLSPGERAYLGMNPDVQHWDTSHPFDENTDPSIWPQIEAILRERFRRGQRFADDDSPTQYGQAEDDAAFRRSINEQPTDLTNHGVYADWLQDEHGDTHPDVLFRRGMMDLIGSRSDPHDPRDLTRSWDRRMTLPPRGLSSVPEIPTWDESAAVFDSNDTYWQHLIRRPAVSTQGTRSTWRWAPQFAGEYSYPRVFNNPWYVDQEQISRILGIQPDEVMSHNSEQWLHDRNPDGGYDNRLTPAELGAYDLTALEEIDPAIWPQVEALLRQRWDKGGQKFAGEQQPTEYDDPYNMPENGWLDTNLEYAAEGTPTQYATRPPSHHRNPMLDNLGFQEFHTRAHGHAPWGSAAPNWGYVLKPGQIPGENAALWAIMGEGQPHPLGRDTHEWDQGRDIHAPWADFWADVPHNTWLDDWHHQLDQKFLRPLYPHEFWRSGLVDPAPGALAHPDDWQSRLVFADWLAEDGHGDFFTPESHSQFRNRFYVETPEELMRETAENIQKRLGQGHYLPPFPPNPNAPDLVDHNDPDVGKQARRERFGYSRTDYNDEATFQRMLDENPDDHLTRMVLADYLDEQGDPRGPGYRALGRMKKTPDFPGSRNSVPTYRPAWFWNERMSKQLGEGTDLPDDWWNQFYTIATTSEETGHRGGPRVDSRAHLEDMAARAFALLPPERQAELLAAVGYSDDTGPTPYYDLPPRMVEGTPIMDAAPPVSRRRRRRGMQYADPADIDQLRANSLDTHLLRSAADWSQEQGFDDEAEFRRLFADWTDNRLGQVWTPPQPSDLAGTDEFYGGGQVWLPQDRHTGFTWPAADFDLPSTLWPRVASNLPNGVARPGDWWWSTLINRGDSPLEDEAAQRLRIDRTRNKRLKGLSPIEHAYAGITPLGDITPEQWAEIVELGRQRWKELKRFSGDGQPTAYGQADDIRGFQHEIQRQPLELTHHGAFADWLEEQGHPDAPFRRRVANWLQDSLVDNPWTPPQENGYGQLLQWGDGFQLPVFEALSEGSRPNIGRRYAPFLTGHSKNWVWRGDPRFGQIRADQPLQQAQVLGSRPRKSGADPEFDRWVREAERHGGAEDGSWQRALTGAERAFAHIDDLGAMDPADWPGVEAIMRERLGRLGRFGRDGAQTNYSIRNPTTCWVTPEEAEWHDTSEPARYAGPDPTRDEFLRKIHEEPDETTNALVFADWLDEQGESALAQVIRSHVEQQGTGAGLCSGPAAWGGQHRLHGGQMTRPPGWRVDSNYYFPADSGIASTPGLEWFGRYPDQATADPIARDLMDSGHIPHGGSYWQEGYDGYLGRSTQNQDRIFDQAASARHANYSGGYNGLIPPTFYPPVSAFRDPTQYDPEAGCGFSGADRDYWRAKPQNYAWFHDEATAGPRPGTEPLHQQGLGFTHAPWNNPDFWAMLSQTAGLGGFDPDVDDDHQEPPAGMMPVQVDYAGYNTPHGQWMPPEPDPAFDWIDWDSLPDALFADPAPGDLGWLPDPQPPHSLFDGDIPDLPTEYGVVDDLGAQVIQHPDDWQLKLVLADALEEAGDPRAALVRAHGHWLRSGQPAVSRSSSPDARNKARSPWAGFKSVQSRTPWLLPEENRLVSDYLWNLTGHLAPLRETGRELADLLPDFHPHKVALSTAAPSLHEFGPFRVIPNDGRWLASWGNVNTGPSFATWVDAATNAMGRLVNRDVDQAFIEPGAFPSRPNDDQDQPPGVEPVQYADQHTLAELRRQLQTPEQHQHRWGWDNPLGGLRGILADTWEDPDHPEAQLLRAPNQHVVLGPGGVIQPGRFTFQPHLSALAQLADLAVETGLDPYDNVYNDFHFITNDDWDPPIGPIPKGKARIYYPRWDSSGDRSYPTLGELMAQVSMDTIGHHPDHPQWPRIQELANQLRNASWEEPDPNRLSQSSAPTEYGPAEDEAAFHRTILEQPLDVINHLVFADWLGDQGRADDEAFRRTLADRLTHKLSTPFAPPEVDAAGWMQRPGSHGSAQVPRLSIFNFGPDTTTQRISERIPVQSLGDWELDHHPVGTWSWAENREYAADQAKALAAQLGLGPDERAADWLYHTWLRSRNPNHPQIAWSDPEPDVLRPEERYWAGIEDWGNLDPRIWPQLEALLRREHGRGRDF